MTVSWEYYDDNRFQVINDMYLPAMGEGETVATQIVTVVNKLVYRWYNDGDVYDNTYYLDGWANDLSSYANWLYENLDIRVKRTLENIDKIYTDGDYEDLLQDLADTLLDKNMLEKYSKQPKVGSIYDCEGPFKWQEYEDDEDDEYYEEYYEEYDEED